MRLPLGGFFRGVRRTRPNLGDWQEAEFGLLNRFRLKPSEPHLDRFGFVKASVSNGSRRSLKIAFSGHTSG